MITIEEAQLIIKLFFILLGVIIIFAIPTR